jgi:hypothetical protein
MSVSNSASMNIKQVLNTIGTAANALTTTFSTVGTAANVLALHADDWLRDTKIKSAAEAFGREAAIVDDVSIAIATRINDRDTQLARNENLKATYNATLPKVQACVDAALGRQAPTAE